MKRVRNCYSLMLVLAPWSTAASDLGHDHFYERIKLQDGVHYFVTGSGGQLRKGDVMNYSPLTAA